MKSKRTSKSAKVEEGLLLNVARTIGSTLGTLAAKTDLTAKPSARRVRASKIGSKAAKARSRRKS